MKQAVANLRAHEAELEARKDEPVATDQMWMYLGKQLRGDEKLGVSWLLSNQHSDDPDLFFAVPVPYVGGGLGYHDCMIEGWGVAYCGRGLWLHRIDLEAEFKRIGFDDASEVRKSLSNMVKGLLGERVEERRDDDEYYDFLDEVGAVTDQLVQKIHFGEGV